MLAQQNAINAPFTFPATANFTVQTSQGGAIFAQDAGGPALLTSYNIVPVQNPAAPLHHQPAAAQLTGESADPAGNSGDGNLSGKMVMTSDNATIYALSQSGFVTLPIGTLQQQPIAMPDSNVALLAIGPVWSDGRAELARDSGPQPGRGPHHSDRDAAPRFRDRLHRPGHGAAIRWRCDGHFQRRRRPARWAPRPPISC